MREVLEEQFYDLAILYLWFWSGISIPEHYLQEIRRFSPATRIAVLTDNQHGLREERCAQLTGLLSDHERGEDFTSREIEICQRADVVLAISEEDRQGLLAKAPELDIVLVPMVAEVAATGLQCHERDAILFVGNYDNQENCEGVEWMLKEVWPIVLRRIPEAKLALAGNRLPERLGAGVPGVLRIGYVADLEPLFAQSRVFASPIRFGTGIKTKNLIALAHGLPLISTSTGAEGLNLRNGVNALIADTPESFAEATVRASSDETLWQELSAAGKQHIQVEFGADRLRTAVQEFIARAQVKRPQRYDPDFAFSYLQVEKDSPEALTQRPAHYRTMLRIMGYWRIGHRFLAEGRFQEALTHFRHTFTSLRGELPATVFHTSLLEDLASCYKALGNQESAERCLKELQKLQRVRPIPAKPRSTVSKKRNPATRPTDLSVIIPTYNRKDTLRLCLSALALQTLPAEHWEVIVVDDGSTDGTEALCRAGAFPFGQIRYIRQENQGAGAARRAGVAAARGEFLLFFNDDTIAAQTLLAQHLAIHRRNPRERWAILGSFAPSTECDRHAVSMWVQRSTFFFPFNVLRPGQFCDRTYFVTCNLSIKRSAVLQAGSFDPAFRVGEDTDLGVRLAAKGYRVKYHPLAAACHEHASFTTADLLKRAAAYGPVDATLYQRHPELLGRGDSPFGKLLPEDYARMERYVSERRLAVQAAIRALEALDGIDLVELKQQGRLSDGQLNDVLRKVARLVPLVYWHALFENFLRASGRSGDGSPQTEPAEVVGAVLS
jgi:GT2 family glycosyltransferase/glycosyltransferase involved in cell wall biosynthesis